DPLQCREAVIHRSRAKTLSKMAEPSCRADSSRDQDELTCKIKQRFADFGSNWISVCNSLSSKRQPETIPNHFGGYQPSLRGKCLYTAMAMVGTV
ncbi:Hypothetical predicted protein, partial [Pelobates cultripes]